MGLRVIAVAFLLVALVGCTGDERDRVATRSTSSTVHPSAAPTTTSTTPSSTSSAPSTTSTPTVEPTSTLPLPEAGCVLEPAEYVEPGPALSRSPAASGPLKVSVVGRNWVWADGHAWVGNDADSVGRAGASEWPRRLVSSEPGCETRRLRGGSELLALTCGDEQFELLITMMSGPCWPTRHDPDTGETVATSGPFTDVLDVIWAGSDQVLRSPLTLEVPDRDWKVTAPPRSVTIGQGTGTWGAEGAVYQLYQDQMLHRYDLDGGVTVSRSVNSFNQRVLGVHDQGLLVAKSVTGKWRPDGQPQTYELAVWDLDTLEEVSVRPIAGQATLLDTGEVVAQQARDGNIGWEQFTTDMWLHDVATGEETLLASIEESIGHRSPWPTFRPRAIVDEELILSWALS